MTDLVKDLNELFIHNPNIIVRLHDFGGELKEYLGPDILHLTDHSILFKIDDDTVVYSVGNYSVLCKQKTLKES